jgi:hypothetical protein
MLQTMTVLDPLAHLQPKSREAEKKARLLELADSILAARNRGVSLTGIVEGIAKLKKRPITVSVDYLNEVMASYHGEAWPKPKTRTRAAGRARDSSAGTPVGELEGSSAVNATIETAGEAEGQAAGQLTDSVPKPVNATSGRFNRLKGQ